MRVPDLSTQAARLAGQDLQIVLGSALSNPDFTYAPFPRMYLHFKNYFNHRPRQGMWDVIKLE